MSISHSLKNNPETENQIFALVLFISLLDSCRSSGKHIVPKINIHPRYYGKIIRSSGGFLKHPIPVFTGIRQKTAWTIILTRDIKSLNDSMTEIQFRDELAYVISKIDCGHTSMKGSKAFCKYVDTASSIAFPFALKFWSDTMVITANLRRSDPILQRGTDCEINQRI